MSSPLAASPVLKLAVRDVAKSWRRSLAAILSISSGFVAICLFQGFLVDVEDLFTSVLRHQLMISGVVIQKTGGSASAPTDVKRFGLYEPEQAFIDGFLAEQGDRVRTRVRFLELSGVVTNGVTTTPLLAYGFDLDEGARVRGPEWEWNTLAGTPLHVLGEGDNLILSRRLGYLLGCEAGPAERLFMPSGAFVPEARPFSCEHPVLQLQTTTPAGQMSTADVTVVGIADSGLREIDDKFAVMPLATAQRLMGTPAVTMYSVEVANPRDQADFLEELLAAAAAADVNIEADRWQVHPVWGDLYRRSIGLTGVFRTFVLLVVALVGAMSIVNTLTRSVVERTRDIGALRSIGYRASQIRLMFTAEGFLLALMACAIGAALSVALTLIINAIGFHYPEGISSYPLPIRIRLVGSAYLLATIGLTAVSTVAALLPARRAARIPVVEALAHV